MHLAGQANCMYLFLLFTYKNHNIETAVSIIAMTVIGTS